MRVLPGRVRLGLRTRLVILVALGGLVITAGGGLLVAQQQRRALTGTLDALLSARLDDVAGQVRSGTPVDQLSLTAPLGLAEVIRPDGTVASSATGSVPRNLLTATFLSRARQQRTASKTSFGEVGLRVLAEPVQRPDGTYVVVVAANDDAYDAAAKNADEVLAIAFVALLLLVILGAVLLARAALRPVEGMRAEAARLGERLSGDRLSDPGTGDELAALALTLNTLLDRLERSAARQRDLVADAGHELRTPLAVLSLELELADRPEVDREALADAVTHARVEVARLTQLAEDLLFLARADGRTQPGSRAAGELVQLSECPLEPLLREAVRASRAKASAQSVTLALHAQDVVAEADPAVLRRAVDNLLANALTHSPPGTVVELSAAEGPTRDWIGVSVTDQGPGFDPDFLPHAFERFRRAESSRSSGSGGAGLGLAIVAEIAAAHGGRVHAENVSADGPGAGSGARVTMVLPAAPAGPNAELPAHRVQEPA